MVQRISLSHGHASQSHFSQCPFYFIFSIFIFVSFFFISQGYGISLCDGLPLQGCLINTKTECRRNGNGRKFQSMRNGSRRMGIGETGVGEMG